MKKAWLAAGIGVLAAVVALGVVAVPAQAFERECKPYEFCVWEWTDMPIPYAIDAASFVAYPPFRPGDPVEPYDPIQVVHDAFRLWANAGTYVSFRYEPNAAFDRLNPKPLIRVAMDPTRTSGASVMATTLRGTIRYGLAHLELAGGGYSRCGFLFAVAHEVGHLLGLGHPLGFDRSRPGPIMSHYFNDGTCPRLNPDDVAGLRYLYPVPLQDQGASQQQVASRPEIGVWPVLGVVSYQGEDFVIAVSHPDGGEALAGVRVLLNGQDETPAAGWLFQLFGRLTPHGGVLSIPKQALANMGVLRQAGIPCWMAEPINCSFFPVRAAGSPFTITVIVRDRAGQEARAERTYTIVP